MIEIGSATQRVCQGMSRRALLQVGALGALGFTFTDWLRLREAAASPGRAHAVILVWLWGGPSHLDTFDMKPDAPAQYRGPFRPIPTNVDGIEICELLPRLARLADRYAIVRSLHHDSNDHGVAGTINLTGAKPNGGRVHPNAGSVVARVRGYGGRVAPFVTVGARLHQGHRPIQGEGGGMLSAVYDPLRVEYDERVGVKIGELQRPREVDERRFAARERLLAAVRGDVGPGREVSALDRFYERAFQMMRTPHVLDVFNLAREPEAIRRRYGLYRFGQSCLLARRLVEAGVPFVQVNWSSHVESEEDAGDGGFDLHYRAFEILQERHLGMLDQSLSALLEDLDQRGLLATTFVAAMGEFGRTPKINALAGRDHWQPCYSALFAGGGVRGGQVIGASDARGEYPVERPVTPGDVYVTMLDRLGITRSHLLELGIPVEGGVIDALF